MTNDQDKKISVPSQEEKPLDQLAASGSDAALTVALPRAGAADPASQDSGAAERTGQVPVQAFGATGQAPDSTGQVPGQAPGATGQVPAAADPASQDADSSSDQAESKDAPSTDPDATVILAPAKQAEPFESLTEDAPDLDEVIARDERSTTQPSLGHSSVKKALAQRPPRRAKAKHGPRTEMLQSIIPDIIIPTDSLSTRAMSKVKVVEASALAQLREIAREQGIEAEEQDRRGAAAPGDEASSAQEQGRLAPAASEAASRNAERPHPRKAAGSRPSPRGGRPSRRPKGSRGGASLAVRIVLCVIALILIASAVLGGLFAWNRWYRFDDAADITGEWKMTNAERTVVITDSTIKIADGVSYDYVLDTKEKTITYSFGGNSTTATYRFSSDRNTLIIDENQETDWLVEAHLREDVVLADRDVPDGMTKLAKISDDTEADPQNTEEVEQETEDYWDPGTFVDGYSDIKRPKIQSADEKDETAKKTTNGTSDDEDDEADQNDDGAAYVDETTGQRYYYDATQMLYYDTAGNYYYDMFGNNPYVL